MNHTRRHLLTALAASPLLATGCLSLPTREEMLASDAVKFGDRNLLAAYYPDPFHRKFENFRIGTDYIEMRRRSFSDGTTHDEAFNEYARVDHSGDDVAMRYLQVTRNRGGKVRLYKAPVNRRIAGMFDKPLMLASEQFHAGADQAYIEFDGRGRMISVFSRFVITAPNIATMYVSQISRIFIGAAARAIENDLKASFLQDHELPLPA